MGALFQDRLTDWPSVEVDSDKSQRVKNDKSELKQDSQSVSQ
jgi:hypothetical protein